MHRRTRAATLALSLITAIGVLAAPAAAAPRTRWVDDDGHAGPNGCGGSAAAKSTIQGAVNAAGPGDTILVCPGTYEGQVVIKGNRDGLTLRSYEEWAAVIKTPASIPRPYGFTALIIIDKVDDVTVEGFRTVARTQQPCDDLSYIVVAAASKGTVIRGNRFLTDSTAGSDCYTGTAVIHGDEAFTGSPRASSATISNNIIRDALHESIVAFSGERSTQTRIYDNSIRAYGTYDGNGPCAAICLTGTAGGKRPAWGPSRSTSTAISGSSHSPIADAGVIIDGPVTGSVEANVIQGGKDWFESGSTFRVGILHEDGMVVSAGGSGSQLVIRGNTIRRVYSGVVLDTVRNVQVRSNAISNVIGGIFLDGTDDSLVRGNQVSAKKGAIIVSASEDNVLTRNTATGVGGSCDDATSGSGTKGTANTWSNNIASEGSDPEGICKLPN